MQERVDEARAMTHDRWVVNKLRALGSWYTKGLDNGSHLRTAINSAPSLDTPAAVDHGFLRRSRPPPDGPVIKHLFAPTLYFS